MLLFSIFLMLLWLFPEVISVLLIVIALDVILLLVAFVVRSRPFIVIVIYVVSSVVFDVILQRLELLGPPRP